MLENDPTRKPNEAYNESNEYEIDKAIKVARANQEKTKQLAQEKAALINVTKTTDKAQAEKPKKIAKRSERTDLAASNSSQTATSSAMNYVNNPFDDENMQDEEQTADTVSKKKTKHKELSTKPKTPRRSK